MNMDNYEIERKYLIRYPRPELLKSCADITEITQTYLIPGSDGETARVRKRGRDGVYTFTHTQKRRVSDIRRVEIEREISEEEYQELLKTADPERRTIYKTRCCLEYRGQLFEIDIYPFWQDMAVLEIELEDDSQPVDLPPELDIIREVTGDKRYTNASLARHIPEEA